LQRDNDKLKKQNEKLKQRRFGPKPIPDISREERNKVWKCLHPDMVPKDKAQQYNEAAQIWQRVVETFAA
jgi:hypothetical protein